MASNWTNLDLSKLFPKVLEALASTISKITTAIIAALTIQKTVLEILAKLAIDFLDSKALLIKAAIKTITDTLDQFLSGGRLHLLIVPFRKRPSEDLQKLLLEPDLPTDEPFSAQSDFDKALYKVSQATGGNAGFLRTVIETINDENDMDRPQYNEAGAIYAVVLVVGAGNVVLLLEALALLKGLFSKAMKNEEFVPLTLVKAPQNLKVKPVSSSNSDKVSTMLSWDNAPALQYLEEFGGVMLRIDEIAIIRSTDDEVVKANDWAALFGGGQPPVLENTEVEREGMTFQSAPNTEILRIYKYDANVPRSTYFDDAGTLEKDKDYYYAVAYRYSVSTPVDQTNNTPLEYSSVDYQYISNVVKIRATDEIPTTGVEPNWAATPSPLDLIPDLKYYVELLKAYAESMAVNTTGVAAALQAYIEFLTAEINRYNEFAQTITKRVQKLASLLKTPSLGLYVTSIELPTGGNTAFLTELVNRMTDKGDPTAPPFHTGQEFVAGMVLLAGATNPAELASTKLLLSMLFGAATSPTPYEEALESIERVVAEQEQFIFGDNMVPGETPTERAVSTATFTKAMTPSEPADPDTFVPHDP